MKKILLTGAFIALATPALAFHCPADMAEIDAALPGATLSEEQMAQVKELRALGEQQHAAGDHQASVDTLAKAKQLLGI